MGEYTKPLFLFVVNWLVLIYFLPDCSMSYNFWTPDGPNPGLLRSVLGLYVIEVFDFESFDKPIGKVKSGNKS